MIYESTRWVYLARTCLVGPETDQSHRQQRQGSSAGKGLARSLHKSAWGYWIVSGGAFATGAVGQGTHRGKPTHKEINCFQNPNLQETQN